MSLEQAVLRVEKLTKSFGQHKVLDALSFAVYSGEVFGIIGKSGAGKSTLLQCLMGLLPPDQGEVFFQSLELTSLTGAALRRARYAIGFVLQQYPLFTSRTALENVRYPIEISNKKGEDPFELLDWVGLADYAGYYPAQLSGGQRQRVAIARALALSPKLMIFDEPTSALDPESTADLLDILRRLQREHRRTLIMITHEMGVIKQLCHRVGVLDGGCFVEEGRTLEVCTQPQHPITRSFLSCSAYPNSEFCYPYQQQGRRFLLRFPPSVVGQGVISKAVKIFNIEANILLGSIDVLLEGAVGNLLVEIEGEASAVRDTLAFLQQAGVLIEEVTR